MSATPQSPSYDAPGVIQLGPYPPPHGGVEINLVAIRDFLRRRKISCDVINLTRHRRPDADGVSYPRGAREVISLLLRSKARIIHLHIGGDVTWRLLLLGLVCALLPGKRTILTLHSGGYPASPAGNAARRMSLRGFLFRRFDGLIGVNQKIVEMFLKFGIPRNKTRMIVPFALSFSARDVSLPECVESFWESHFPRLLTVSGLEPEYDLPLQLEAMREVLQQFPNAGLMICGTGSLIDQIREEIAAKPYASHILLAGDLPHDTVLKIVSNANMFVRTTQYDGDSIAVRESLHFGIPTIVTDTGMRPPGVHLIPIGSKTALVKEICELASSLGADGDASQATPASPDERNLLEVLKLYEEVSKIDFGSGTTETLVGANDTADLPSTRGVQALSERQRTAP
jgi:glycogen synthase